MSIKYFVFCGVVAAGLALAACGQPNGSDAAASAQGSAPAAASAATVAPARLAITSWGPQSTKAGTVFNAQPGGAAAIWIRVDQPLEGYEVAVDFNGTLLKGNISGNLVTASVPANLYATSGNYAVQVLARKGNDSAKSNGVTFAVE